MLTRRVFDYFFRAMNGLEVDGGLEDLHSLSDLRHMLGQCVQWKLRVLASLWLHFVKLEGILKAVGFLSGNQDRKCKHHFGDLVVMMHLANESGWVWSVLEHLQRSEPNRTNANFQLLLTQSWSLNFPNQSQKLTSEFINLNHSCFKKTFLNE